MAITPLSMIAWEYDDSIGSYGQVTARFIDNPPPDHPDPANYVPIKSIVMRLTLSLPAEKAPLPTDSDEGPQPLDVTS